MRNLAVTGAIWLAVAGAAAAQGYPSAPSTGYPPPPPGYPPPSPAYPPPSAAYPPPQSAYPPPSTYQPAYPGAYSSTGARPGNEIGTGSSEPRSNRASNINQYDTRSDIAPNLPGPHLGPDSPPADYLRAAQASLMAGRTGEAQQSLEMAQTRLLDRSVPYGQTGTPSDNPAVRQISDALQALAAHDRQRCLQLIEAAIPSAQASYR